MFKRLLAYDLRLTEVEMAEFEPRIVAFLCHWCTYTGADLAGTTRQQYPPNIRVDPSDVLRGGGLHLCAESPDRRGGWGLIGGCHPGDCHYQTGNYKARRRVAILKGHPQQDGLYRGSRLAEMDQRQRRKTLC